MALRVLLADESSTIKKVFQLALQDYAVEVRPVNIGVDVAMVAKGFKPDIIFADVMLQKKNGYDVCAELKQDAALRGIPFVLMWSGFVDLDEDKFQASHANAQLEKPFDVAALRKLVSDLVPRTQSQSLSQYLTFPKGTVEAEKRPDILENAPAASGEEEDFTQMPIPKMKSGQSEKYRINLKPEELDPSHSPVEFDAQTGSSVKTPPAKDAVEEFTMRENKKPTAPPVKIEAKAEPPATPAPQVSLTGELDLDVEDMSEFAPRQPAAAAKPAPSAPAVQGALTAAQLEKIIREQSVEVIESVVWKVIPELATQIIERELKKLLQERDSLPY
jgi:CheY-like chemotaxis protein